MGTFFQITVQLLTKWSQNPVIVAAVIGAIASSILTLIAVFFRKIGNIFSHVVKWAIALLSKRGKDYAFERKYLTWIINQHRYLGLLPSRVVAARHSEEGRNVDLEKVYVPLRVSAKGGDQNSTETYTEDAPSWRKQPWFYTMLKKKPWFYSLSSVAFIILSISIISILFFHYSLIIGAAIIIPLVLLGTLLLFIRWRVSRTEKTYQLGDLALAIDTHKQLVIRGDPGSGKTTLLRYLAVTCARALRNDKKYGDASDLVKKWLLWTTRPFPILITLRRFSNVAAEKRLIDIFLEELPSELRTHYPPDFFERKLKRGNCLILLDALDELGSPQARSTMARRINDFQSNHNHHRNRIVATTRIVGYEGQLDQYGFQLRTVQRLNAGEIRALIKQRYEAIALSETAGWKSHDASPIKQNMRQRSEQLITKVESTPRLTQLATNPLLLSLIVLVHRVKIALPEERVQLYRECVEILTEQWLRFKLAESNIQPDRQEDLNLSQKLSLLQALALNMQQKREEEDRETLLPQSQVQEIIADKLPDILGSQLPADKDKHREACRRRAETWVKDIQTESGILVEQGLDDAGNPLIGFSHLTFQEYLAACAINDTPAYYHLLTSHLMQPAWREVVLLYVALTSDATPIVAQLLDAPQQPAGLVLAGSCLAEKVKYVKNEVQQLALTKLKASFEQADESMAKTLGPILRTIGRNEITAFMREQLHNTMLAKRLEAIKALGQIQSTDPLLKDVQKDLLKLLETPNDVALMIVTREALAQIGDPRFTGEKPIVVSIPQQTGCIPSSPKNWKELYASPEWIGAKKLRQRVALRARIFDYWWFTKFHRLRQHLPDKHAFAISKYPVTNIEYANFVKAERYPAPKYWTEGTYSAEKATHPVTGVTREDAEAYCKWLSKKTGEIYRLPTEWEWEWATTGSQRQQYPWGEQFGKDKCNTEEAAIGETTPVGSYLDGTSQCSPIDMIGNVWEITQGSTPSAASVGGVGVVALVAVGVVGVVVVVAVVVGGVVVAVALVAVVVAVELTEDIESGSFTGVLRGGAFDTSSDQATCFFRKGYKQAAHNAGFRCVKEL